MCIRDRFISVEWTSSCVTLYDQSDVAFTIASNISVTQPVGGEVWQAQVGSQPNITNSSVTMSNAPLELNTVMYNINNGNYTQTLVPDNPNNKLKLYAKTIDVPNGAHFNIYDGPSTSSPHLTHYSNYYGTNKTWVSTHYTGALTIEVYNGNVQLDGYITSEGTPKKTISWDIVGTSGEFDIDYSVDNGLSWTPIVTDVHHGGSTGSYDWQVPNIPTTQALVRVVDRNNGNIVSQSASAFTITAADPVIILDNVNGGQTFFPDDNEMIEWRVSKYNVPQVQIELSKNNGQSWELLSSNHSNVGPYNWSLPNIIDSVSSNCLIKVSKQNDPSVLDQRDAE